MKRFFSGSLQIFIVMSFSLLFITGNTAQNFAFDTDATKCESTIPLPGDTVDSDEIRFSAIGDTGRGSQPQIDLAEKVLCTIQPNFKFNLFLFLGDNVYNFGKPKDFKKKLYDPYRCLTNLGVEFRGVLGNHDVFSSKGVKEQQKFFNMGTNTFYSFTKGNQLVEFFALDSSLLTGNFWKKHTDSTKEQELAWLKEALKNSTAKWKIVLLHHPLYSSAKGHGVKKVNKDGTEKEVPKKMKIIRGIEDDLKTYNVKIVLGGHDHTYERIKPQSGIYHFVSGAGAKLRTKHFNRKRLPNYHQCGNSQELSFMLFSVKPNAIVFWAINAQGKPFDSGKIE